MARERTIMVAGSESRMKCEVSTQYVLVKLPIIFSKETQET